MDGFARVLKWTPDPDPFVDKSGGFPRSIAGEANVDRVVMSIANNA